ncbi:hypothetical protein ONZ51_g4251 [Trametes cubensis]|uniref:Uncharacterized protein n=1 Tax=Trametes cubensis TaxID=1111947 RepID=A0AAD7TX81_9APHY|nr:hypothetical protein ONZ51_g4251 [Trametes cubensis]
MSVPISAGIEPKFASGFVRFTTQGPQAEDVEVHIVLARINERQYAIVVKPRLLALDASSPQVLNMPIDNHWTFSCNESTRTVSFAETLGSQAFQLVFTHKCEFWSFIRRFTEARNHSLNRDGMERALLTCAERSI